MILSTRPDWTRSTTGIPIDCVVRIHGGQQGTRQDITPTRNRVALVRPGALQAKPEDEFEASFVYGPEASNGDVVARSITPLLKKFIEGYNVTVLTFGATGAGKTTSLEGGRANDAGRGAGGGGDGMVHLAASELFKLLNQKAVAVGDMIAQRRRMPSAKAFDFFLESTFVEVYNEGVHDLYQRPAAVGASLPVYEDEMDGYQVSGLTYRIAKNEGEVCTSFNTGRQQRDAQMTDLGSVHERAAAIFSLHLAQYAPAATPGEEDRVVVSRMQFVDMPGAERLAMDPELLRLREGTQLNRSLLAFASVLRTLSEGAVSADYANHEESVLTRLLADALGGNALTLMVGCIRQGEWELSATTLRTLATARRGRNFPVINHGRSRGLLRALRHRLLAIAADRATLQDQLSELPADGDPNAVAISIAKVRDLEARLLAEREEKGRLVEEKQALQARLMKLRDAGTDDLREKADVQEALIKSEELRLALAKTLIDTQMEYNETEAGWAKERLELEQRLAELEAGHMEHYVRSEDAAGLEQERDELNSRLLAATDELQRKESAITDLKNEVEELKAKLRKAEHELNLIGGEHHPTDETWNYKEEDLVGLDPNSLEAKRRQLFIQLRAKDRKISELQAEARDMSKEVDRLRNTRNITQSGVDEMREAYRRKLEVVMRDVADLGRAVAIMQDDPNTGVRVKPEDLFSVFTKLADENLRVTDDREREMRQDMDDLQGRHVELKRKFRALYLAYRQIRYLIQDRWPQGSEPLRVPTEEEVLGAAVDSISRSEEEADRRMIARLRQQASQLGTQLGALQVAEAAAVRGVPVRASDLSKLPRDNTYETDRFIDMPEMVRLENDKLREELDKLRGQVAGTPIDRLKSDNTFLQAKVRELGSDKSRDDMAGELARAKLEIDRLRKQLATGFAGVGPGGSAVNDVKGVAAQIREMTGKSQVELERKLAAAESGRIMAEEQLNSLQAYLTKANMQYQKEIMRLRAIVGQVDPSGALLRSNPIRGK